jgi:redox-sensitive bicupin YhaK (pirin superfamily)
MSAGHGIEHSEFNASTTQPVHFLQIWLQPDRVNAAPAYAQRTFEPSDRRGHWTLLASPDGAEGSIAIRQQARLRGVLLANGEAVEFDCDPARRYWLHVAQGTVRVDDRLLEAGDALGFVAEGGSHRLQGLDEGALADVLLFDLPA